MNLFNSIINNPLNSELTTGEWFCIKWKPDPVIGEQLNIGVAVRINGKLHSRILNYFERIRCLYDEAGVTQVEIITSIATEVISKNNITNSIDQITFEKKGFCQGLNVNDILDSLYAETVPLAKKIRVRAPKEKFSSISTEKVYISLINELKLISGLGYENIAPKEPSIYVGEEGAKQKLFLPFRDGADLIGGLASAVYSDPTKIELNILKAARDVESARRFRNAKKPAIFILTPDDRINTLGTQKVDSINTILDTFSWHMNKHGVTVGSHTEINGLAEEIAKWSHAA